MQILEMWMDRFLKKCELESRENCSVGKEKNRKGIFREIIKFPFTTASLLLGLKRNSSVFKKKCFN
jgi:hypothetical protein